MSKLVVEGVRIEDVLTHPNADALDLIKPEGKDFLPVVQKGRYAPGDFAIYVGEGAVLSEELLKETRFWDEEKDKGMLAGALGNRVKPVKLRGHVSQGILINPAAVAEIEHGADYAEALGIVKYEVPIPAHLAGEVDSLGVNFTYTDIENIKNWPDVFVPGEVVVAHEKLHGTCLVFSLRFNDETEAYDFVVSSKGQAGKGFAIRESESNYYWRVAKKYGIHHELRGLLVWFNVNGHDLEEVTLFGEGLGVQDLKYGSTNTDAEARFFDIRFTPKDGEPTYVDSDPLSWFLSQMGLPRVPRLYTGPFDIETITEAASGRETLTGKETHVREGAVVRPILERRHPSLGRVILKVISPDYLTRKGDATEYE